MWGQTHIVRTEALVGDERAHLQSQYLPSPKSNLYVETLSQKQEQQQKQTKEQKELAQIQW